jgi:uncharacterized membrane protein
MKLNRANKTALAALAIAFSVAASAPNRGALADPTPISSPTTIIVTNTNDSGSGSVRQALADAQDGARRFAQTYLRPHPRGLSLAQRVAYRQQIGEVYWRHWIWPKERADSKPSVDQVMPPARLEPQVSALEIIDLGAPNEESDAYALNDLDYVFGSSGFGNLSHSFVYHDGSMTDLDSLGRNWAAGGINNLGQIASGIVATNGIFYPAIYDVTSGQLRILGSLGGVHDGFSGGALAINNFGQATGYGYAANLDVHSFFYDGTVMHDIGCPQIGNSCESYAQAINDLGQIVGFSGAGAFIYSGGVTTQIVLPEGGTSGAARGINNHGDVVGDYWNGFAIRAFVYANGIFTTITDDHSLDSVPFDINDAGQVVGEILVVPDDSCRYCFGDYRQHAFIYQNGQLTDLNSLLPSSSDWELSLATAINEQGHITGYGLHNGQTRGFLMSWSQPAPTPTPTPPAPSPTPTPEPPTPACDLTGRYDDITTLSGAGWLLTNHSTPIGTTNWFQGNSQVFPSQSGVATSYIGANFNNTTGANTISNWLLTPPLALANGAMLSFWTRTVNTPAFPDRLQVRMSTNGASSNVGTTAIDVGDFITLLLDINPTYTTSGYPNAWTHFTVTLSGIASPTTGRLAFRYFVENAGPSGVNADYIGIDTVEYVCNQATPTPSPAPGGCVFRSGYWMNHPSAWCMETIQIGCQSYTQAQAIAIMRHNSSQDKTYTLAQQLITAKLNIACKSTSSSCISSAIVSADSWLCAHSVGSGVTANSSAWQAIKMTYQALANYNGGTLCSPSCDAN